MEETGRSFQRFQISKFATLILAAISILSLSGCPNVFSESAQKTSDEALLYQANLAANTRDWTGAITIINSMTAAGRARRETRYNLASYYAGRCGMELLGFATDLVDGFGGGQLLWPVLMNMMKSATASEVADCVAAETELLAISTTPSDRTADENILLAFVEFAKMGAVLATSGADTNDDGSIEGAFDPCTDDASNIEDANIQKLATGLTIGITSLSAAGSGVAGDALGDIDAMCDAVDTFMAQPAGTFCGQTAEADFTGSELLVMRALIKSAEVGFNTCSGPLGQTAAGTASDCHCPVVP